MWTSFFNFSESPISKKYPGEPNVSLSDSFSVTPYLFTTSFSTDVMKSAPFMPAPKYGTTK